MVIERQDSILKSLAKTKNPLRILGGERTWSQLSRQSKPTILLYDAFWGTGREKVVGFKNEDEVVYMETISALGHIISVEETSFFRQEEINSPNSPWAGKLRWKPTQNPEYSAEVVSK